VLMSEQSLFLESDLSMPKLADALTTSPNYLSQTLNTYIKMNFFDYINSQRIIYAKSLLNDESKKHMSVIDVAMASAFNSKSAFYTAFKKHVGLTPAQYRKNEIN